MATFVAIPVSEYLDATYRPDRDYIDGKLEERNVGEEAHAEVQAILARIIGNKRVEWGVRVLTEVRVQTSETHFRIPDVCVVDARERRGKVIHYAPLLCVEIISRDDRVGDLQDRVADYAGLGVQNIWLINPLKRVGYHASTSGFLQPDDGVMRAVGTSIEIRLAEVFAELDGQE